MLKDNTTVEDGGEHARCVYFAPLPCATPHIIARPGVEDGNTLHMVIVAANQPAPPAAPEPAAASGDSPLQQPVPSGVRSTSTSCSSQPVGCDEPVDGSRAGCAAGDGRGG